MEYNTQWRRFVRVELGAKARVTIGATHHRATDNTTNNVPIRATPQERLLQQAQQYLSLIHI